MDDGQEENPPRMATPRGVMRCPNCDEPALCYDNGKHQWICRECGYIEDKGTKTE